MRLTGLDLPSANSSTLLFVPLHKVGSWTLAGHSTITAPVSPSALASTITLLTHLRTMTKSSSGQVFSHSTPHPRSSQSLYSAHPPPPPTLPHHSHQLHPATSTTLHPATPTLPLPPCHSHPATPTHLVSCNCCLIPSSVISSLLPTSRARCFYNQQVRRQHVCSGQMYTVHK